MVADQLREKLVKIGAKVVRHARYAVFRMAKVAVPRELFGQILRLRTELSGWGHHHGRSASEWRGKEPNQWINSRFGRWTPREPRENCVDRLWLHRNPAGV